MRRNFRIRNPGPGSNLRGCQYASLEYPGSHRPAAGESRDGWDRWDPRWREHVPGREIQMSAPESFRSIPLHFRDLHGKPQRQQVRKQESRRARDGSGSWKTSCLECVAHIGAGAIILNREMKYTGTHQGAGELRTSKMILLLAVAMLVATGKVCAQTQATGGETPSPVVVPDSGKKQPTEEP